MIVVTVNYRLGVFGFLAHPDLTGESPHHASGNYGFLDRVAALQWIHKNIHAFGGDNHRVTIGGQSAGSESVTAQMVSPLSHQLFSAVLAESGSILGVNNDRGPKPLRAGEAWGQKFAHALHADSIAALRKIPATAILAAAFPPDFEHPPVVIDGYFLTEAPRQLSRLVARRMCRLSEAGPPRKTIIMACCKRLCHQRKLPKASASALWRKRAQDF